MLKSEKLLPPLTPPLKHRTTLVEYRSMLHAIETGGKSVLMQYEIYHRKPNSEMALVVVYYSKYKYFNGKSGSFMFYQMNNKVQMFQGKKWKFHVLTDE